MDKLEKIDKDFVLNTYARDYTNFTHGQNARIWDENDNCYIDFAAGIGVNSVGHNNEKLIQTITSQAQKIIHNSNLFLIAPQAKLAQKISQLLGYKTKSFFCNSGLEANECAIKIARKYGESTNRFKIITLKNSFHGRSIATLAACGQDKMHTHFAPFPDGFLYAENIQNAIEIAKCDKQVIAIFIELIQGEGGIYAFPKDEIKALRNFTNQNDILLMIDEVQSGVFRSGSFLTSQIYDIKPDVSTLAKGLAGGIPIGATITTQLDIFAPGEHGSTFGGNFLSTSAALCVLEILENLQTSGALAKTIEIFNNHLEKISKEFGLQSCGMGLMRGLKLNNDEILNHALKMAKNELLIALKSGNSTMRFLPPLTIDESELESGFARLKNAFKKL